MSRQSNVVPIMSEGSGSGSSSARSAKPLTISQLRKVTRILAPTLPTGFLGYFKGQFRPRQVGAYWTVPNRCPKCGMVPPEHMESALQRRRFMFVHAITAH